MKNKLLLSIGLMMGLTAMTESEPKGSFKEVAEYVQALPERTFEYIQSGKLSEDTKRKATEFKEDAAAVVSICWAKMQEACEESGSALKKLERKRNEEKSPKDQLANRKCSGQQSVPSNIDLGKGSGLLESGSTVDVPTAQEVDYTLLKTPVEEAGKAAGLEQKEGLKEVEGQPSKGAPAETTSGE